MACTNPGAGPAERLHLDVVAPALKLLLRVGDGRLLFRRPALPNTNLLCEYADVLFDAFDLRQRGA